MALWRCPHCGTPQPVTARCWVCRRSSTSCGTCRHFRSSVAARIGYCGLDRTRRPLAGDEIRSCWTGGMTLEMVEPSVVLPSPEVVAAPRVPGPYMGGFVSVEPEPVAVEPEPVVLEPPVAEPPASDEPTATAPPLIPAADPARDGLFWTELEG